MRWTLEGLDGWIYSSETIICSLQGEVIIK